MNKAAAASSILLLISLMISLTYYWTVYCPEKERVRAEELATGKRVKIVIVIDRSQQPYSTYPDGTIKYLNGTIIYPNGTISP